MRYNEIAHKKLSKKDAKDKYPHMVRHPKGETISEGMSIRTFYHGSDHHITAFSLDHLGKGQGADQEGPGIYLTSSKEDAKKYGKIIHTVAVSIPKSRLLKKKRALRAGVESLIRRAPDRDETLQNWDENPQIGFYKAVDSIMDAYGDDCREAYEAVWGDFYRDHSADYLRRLIRFGYDGFELPRPDGIVHLIAFNPAKLRIVSAEERVVEQMLTATPWYGERKPFFVYKNPTVEEYDRAIGDDDGVRAFVKDNDLYVWKTGAGIHAVVYEQLKLTDAIPLYTCMRIWAVLVK